MPNEISQKVLIVGAGPVGLVTAALLVGEGIPVVVLEACAELPHDLRASTFHPPTLDMLERFGVVGAMIDQGLICPTWQFRDRKDGVVATFELSRLEGDTDHPYRIQCEQWRLGEMLFAQLKTNPLATIRLRHLCGCGAPDKRRRRGRCVPPGRRQRDNFRFIRRRR